MLENISIADIKIIYSAYMKKNLILKQSLKEKIYMHYLLLLNGKKYLIVGPSGSGKTTILNIIAGKNKNYNGFIR
jgi:ABC-type Fe3+/spermidine/putrescine transport system ATPase subunit